MQQKENIIKERRTFLKLMALGGLTAGNGVTALQAGSDRFEGYKAIVFLYQSGGNDGLNTFIPISDDPRSGYRNYAGVRSNISVADRTLTLPRHNNRLDLNGGNPYTIDNSLSQAYTKGFYIHNGFDLATNALMPELADLIDQNKVAIIANCGNLITPATKKEFAQKSKPLPPFLFAHNHQTKLALNGEAALLDYTGWAGRLYDLFKDINDGDIYGLNLSVAEHTHLFEGTDTTPLILSPKGPVKYKQIYRALYNDLLTHKHSSPFNSLYNRIRSRSFAMQDTIIEDWTIRAPDFSTYTNAYGNTLFTAPDNEQLQQSPSLTADFSLLKQLEAVAKLAKIGKARGLKRQIFFVKDGGYDTHDNQFNQHARKLRGLSLALGDFALALDATGMSEEVTLLSSSDFGRTSGDNGDGTDHAWGNSYFVLGGAVRGGLYGKLPDLTLGSDDDLTHKGRIIPTLSMSQYYATVVRWFGLTEEELSVLFPELVNFPQKDIGFMRDNSHA